MEGDGIFQVFAGSSDLPTNFWTADHSKNIVYVEGCKLTDFLSSRPFGQLTFSYVLLPDYVTGIPPIKIQAYSDKAYSKLIFEDGIDLPESML